LICAYGFKLTRSLIKPLHYFQSCVVGVGDLALAQYVRVISNDESFEKK
jgi:hypothetical protein